jgi:methyl-accepting chemotaxis protein
MKLFVHPVPENDFRVAIANDIKEELERHYAEAATSKVEEIMRDATERLVEFIKRIAHACREVESEGDGKVRKPKVYEGTIEGAKEMCELLKDFNLTGDKRLEEIRQDVLATLNDVTAKDIRESDATRSHVKSEMDKIMNKFGLINL